MVFSEATLEQVNSMRARPIAQPRVSVTELARTSAWRKQLKKDKVMEVLDRNNSVGWLLSPEGMQAMLDTMDYFEAELERVQVAYMCALRADSTDWASGQKLAQGAMGYLDANFDAMQAAIENAE